MNQCVYIVYLLFTDGSKELDRVFGSETSAKGYIDKIPNSKAFKMHYEEVEVEY